MEKGASFDGPCYARRFFCLRGLLGCFLGGCFLGFLCQLDAAQGTVYGFVADLRTAGGTDHAALCSGQFTAQNGDLHLDAVRFQDVGIQLSGYGFAVFLDALIIELADGFKAFRQAHVLAASVTSPVFCTV